MKFSINSYHCIFFIKYIKLFEPMGFYIFNSKLHFRYTITTISVIPDKDGQLAVFFRSSLLADLKYIRLGKGN